MMDNDIEKTRFYENGQLPLFPVKPLEVWEYQKGRVFILDRICLKVKNEDLTLFSSIVPIKPMPIEDLNLRAGYCWIFNYGANMVSNLELLITLFFIHCSRH